MHKIDGQKLSADELLEVLLEGNRAFKNNEPRIKNHCFNEMKKTLKDGQKPYALILGCSDSRVAPEIIFDTGLGELFVVRAAGGTLGPNMIESLEYAVAHLKIKLLVILSHQDCGVMKYAIDAPINDNDYENLVYHVHSIKTQTGSTCADDLARKYGTFAKSRLLKKSRVIEDAYKQGDLKFVQAYFELETGEVKIIDKD